MNPRTSTTTPEAYGKPAGLLNLAAAAILAFAPLAAAQTPDQPPAEPAADAIVIAALGDSLVHGWGVPEADGFVPQLQAWLADNGAADVRLVNAGVSGDTSAGGLARVDWTLTPEIDAVIVELGANDLLRGIDPAETRANLDGVLAAIAARDLPVLLVGVPGIGNFGSERRAAFDAIYVDLAATHATLLYPNFFAAIGDLTDLTGARPLMQEDMIHPNAAGVAAIVAAIGPAVLDLAAAARQGSN